MVKMDAKIVLNPEGVSMNDWTPRYLKKSLGFIIYIKYDYAQILNTQNNCAQGAK